MTTDRTPTTAAQIFESALRVADQYRERMQRFETGRNDESDTYYVAATDRTVLISQLDRLATLLRQPLLAALRAEPRAEGLDARMLAAWRETKDFLCDRLVTSGRSDVSINAVLRVMNSAFDDVALAPEPDRTGQPS